MLLAHLISQAIAHKPSDWHLSAGLQPIIRVNGLLQKLDFAALGEKELNDLLLNLMDSKQQQIYKELFELDFSFKLNELFKLVENQLISEEAPAQAAISSTLIEQFLACHDSN